MRGIAIVVSVVACSRSAPVRVEQPLAEAPVRRGIPAAWPALSVADARAVLGDGASCTENFKLGRGLLEPNGCARWRTRFYELAETVDRGLASAECVPGALNPNGTQLRPAEVRLEVSELGRSIASHIQAPDNNGLLGSISVAWGRVVGELGPLRVDHRDGTWVATWTGGCEVTDAGRQLIAHGYRASRRQGSTEYHFSWEGTHWVATAPPSPGTSIGRTPYEPMFHL